MESECASGEAVQRGVALLLGCFGGWARRSSRVSDDCVSAGEKPLGKTVCAAYLLAIDLRLWAALESFEEGRCLRRNSVSVWRKY